MIEVVVVTPARCRNMYRFDSERGAVRLVRQLPDSLVYPCEYGFVPATEAEGGNPLDALVLVDEPTFPGCWISVVPIGVLLMEDEYGRDNKIVTVLPERAEHEALEDIRDLPPQLLDDIEHFFANYKDLDPARRIETHGFAGRPAAITQIARALERYARGQPQSFGYGPAGRAVAGQRGRPQRRRA
jgi:inorganic pyrophosphatase